MPSIAAATIFLFGITSLGAGLHGLWQTAQSASSSSSSSSQPSLTTQAMTANYLAATAMGIYYPLAACQENRAFFLATVPMRLLTATVFWLQQWTAASVWEGTGAVLTGLAILWDSRQVSGRPKVRKMEEPKAR